MKFCNHGFYLCCEQLSLKVLFILVSEENLKAIILFSWNHCFRLNLCLCKDCRLSCYIADILVLLATFILVAKASVVNCGFRWDSNRKDFLSYFFFVSTCPHLRFSTLLTRFKFCSVDNLIFKFLGFFSELFYDIFILCVFVCIASCAKLRFASVYYFFALELRKVNLIIFKIRDISLFWIYLLSFWKYMEISYP